MGSMQFDREGESGYGELNFTEVFKAVEDVLKCSISAAEKCFLGKNGEMEVTLDNPRPSMGHSLILLRQICSVVAIGGDSSMADVEAEEIVNKVLSNYSGSERAVLGLAAFAWSYGELMAFADPRLLINSFAQKISFLTQVDEINKVLREEHFKIAIRELNDLTKLTIRFVGSILQLEELSKKDCIDDMSVLADISTIVNRYSFKAIQALVPCIRQVIYPTYYSIRIGKGSISAHASFLEEQLKELRKVVQEYKQQIKLWEAYSELHRCICSRSGIVKVMNCMMSPGKALLELKDEKANVEDLRGKNVLLLISKLDGISKDDMKTLEKIHKCLQQEKLNYKIVWIPVVEKWSSDVETFISNKKKMPWYVVNYEKAKQIAAIKYIKKRWHFSYEPMVVVLNPRGAVESLDGMHIIRAWGKHAFSFPTSDALLDPLPRMSSIICHLLKQDRQKIREEEYILYFGSKDGKWINQFKSKVKDLNESVEAKIVLPNFVYNEKNSNKVEEEEEEEQFWSRIDSLLFLTAKWNPSDNATKLVFNKLLSLKNKNKRKRQEEEEEEKGDWAILCKGEKVIACASGSEFLQIEKESFKLWMSGSEGKKELGIYLEEYFKSKSMEGCNHVAFKSYSLGLPLNECPGCGERVRRIITYKCPRLEKKQDTSESFENGDA